MIKVHHNKNMHRTELVALLKWKGVKRGYYVQVMPNRKVTVIKLT